MTLFLTVVTTMIMDDVWVMGEADWLTLD